jgi:CRP-like cAMP-binding protein
VLRSDHPSPRVTFDMVRDARLFKGMSDDMLRHLAEVLPAESAAPGQALISEGEVASHMFVVLGGEVEVSHKGGSDHNVRVALLGPGDWVGEMAILDVQPRSATVQALSPSLLLRLTAADVKQHIYDRDVAQYALLVMNIARELSRRLRVADTLIASSAASMAHEYVTLSRRP